MIWVKSAVLQSRKYDGLVLD